MGKSRRAWVVGLTCVVVCLVAARAVATDYNIVMLTTAPQDAGGQAFGIWNGQAVGDVGGVGGVLWTDPSHYVPLSPTPAGSVVNAIFDNQQVGWVPVNNQMRAALWSGSAASYTDLSGGGTSYATATDGAQQVGVAAGGAGGLASLWSGTAASYVNLNPSTYLESYATGVSNGLQVGYGRETVGSNALTWSGSAGSFNVLRQGAEAFGIHGRQAVGLAVGRTGSDAAMWTDATSASFVDLAPLAATASELLATNGVQQVGDVSLTGGGMGAPPDHHAAVWTGTVDSFQMLPSIAGRNYSIATGIDSQGDISGYIGAQVGGSVGGFVPVIWQPVPEPPTVALIVASALLCHRGSSRRLGRRR